MLPSKSNFDQRSPHMHKKQLDAYFARRYVIACEGIGVRAKLFQIAFAKSDGSIFVTFPYGPTGLGRVGQVTLDPTLSYPSCLSVGESFPVTSHAVKYSHHPSGRAHFSLSGKVLNSVGKSAVPLFAANGHIFTVMLQGVEAFAPLEEKDHGNTNRGVVPFGLESQPVKALKFLGYLYSQSELSRRFDSKSNSPWFLSITPSGLTCLSIALATPYRHEDEAYFLLVSLQEIERICDDQETFLTLMGGFDDPNTAFNHSVPTSFLLSIYPAESDFEDLVHPNSGN